MRRLFQGYKYADPSKELSRLFPSSFFGMVSSFRMVDFLVEQDPDDEISATRLQAASMSVSTPTERSGDGRK